MKYSPELLLRHAIEGYTDEIDISHIHLTDDFNIKLTLKGDKWDGLIDYRIANYVLNVQKDILKIISDIIGQDINLRNYKNFDKNIIVRVQIEKGSTKLFVQLKEIYKTAIDKMNGTQALLLLSLTGVLLTGTYNHKIYSDKVQSLAKIQKDEKIQNEVLKIGQQAIDLAKRNNNSMNYIINQMEEGDTITLPNSQKKLSKSEAKDKAEKETLRPIEQTFFVDDIYEITAINLEAQSIALRKHKKKFTASIKVMPNDEKIKLHEKVTEADLAQTYAISELHVSAIIADKQIIEAYVTAIGPKRDKAVALNDIIKNTNQSLPATQTSLLDHIDK